jgi:spore coat protein U-like protein
MYSAVKRSSAGRRWVLAGWLALAVPAAAQSCYVSGAFGLNFGAVSSAGKDASASITYTCTPDYSGAGHTYYYQLCLHLEPGGWSVGQHTRRMSNYNNAFLRYDLFADPARTQAIGGLGTSPVYRFVLEVAPGSPETRHAQIYGRVYPGQSVPALGSFQEQGILGILRWRHDTAGFPQTDDCATGGSGGSATGFNSSGVLATFENSCTIEASDLDFGHVEPSERGIPAQANIRVQCPANTAWRIGLGSGQYASGGERRMRGSSGGFITYALYRDAGRAEPWGNVDGEMAHGQTDTHGAPVELTVHGFVPGQPDVEPGAYRDSVVATVYY